MHSTETALDMDKKTSVSSPSARDRLIVALDYADSAAALGLVASLQGAVQWYKVGLELYLSAGSLIVSTLVDRGYSVFLDLKLHDIPNTVAGGVRSAARSGASLLTIHAAGGPAMVSAAVEAVASVSGNARVLAVTVLTSMDARQLAATGVYTSPSEQVSLLAAMAIEAGADGLVCSAEESASLRAKLGQKPLLVTPGIRPTGSAIGDQKRIATPAGALQSGASYLVVGRPITQAADPRQAAKAILAEMQTAL
jgi:orotidine-5'-phosphate decarboxylase